MQGRPWTVAVYPPRKAGLRLKPGLHTLHTCREQRTWGNTARVWGYGYGMGI
ncbi:hypothetical protein GGTG_09644 [Gaeumannomyces tritici R3-111a-1]|uniref:Uncharacterized protein n=1 Tax=Gaeumannomyces tritici (strain R3-111a-1) TaxID=644352 RepID=J3P806_GAET3|nr:hypothetical protein GGTG_09644 [Gaeumannomyces tritici R3-111a-1]EJT72789.1 hypothetical protein GGTG_09644 [Gaeumannomyces tritici R3-111a-1]